MPRIFAASIVIGARLGGADEGALAKHQRAGDQAGVAFQIDIEDAVGLGSQIATIQSEIEDQI